MATQSIEIIRLNTAIGTPASADGVMGIISKAVAVVSTFALDTFYLGTKLADFEALGINAAYDTTNSTALHQHIKEFYEEAGDGKKLWVMGIAKTTDFATLVASEAFDTALKITGTADPLNLIKVFGLCYDVPSAAQTAADFPTDVTATIPLLQSNLATLEATGYCISAVVDGYNMSTSVTPATIGTMATQASPNVSLLITGTKDNRVSSVGQYLGRLAKISVGTNPGKVEDGALVNAGAYLTNKVAANTLYDADFTNLGSKQFVFARTQYRKSGYFYNDGATCDLVEKAFATIEFNRIAKKLSMDARAFFVDEIGKSLPLDVTSGAVDAGYCSAKADKYFELYINPLILSGDISGAKMTVTGPNFVADRKLYFKLEIVGAPALRNVSGTIEFVQSL